MKKMSMLLAILLLVLIAGCQKTTTTTTTTSTTASTVPTTTTTAQAQLIYPSGTFNYKFAPDDVRLDFFAAAEKYLVTTNDGGIPVFDNSGYEMFSPRMQLPVQTYNPVLGFGTIWGTMSADDSTVLMDTGSYGTAGQYTFRTSENYNPSTFNLWQAQDSVSSDIGAYLFDSIYSFQFNSDKTNFVVVPSMASALPQPVNSTTINGQTVSNTWDIPIRSGLTWQYASGTDTSKLPAGSNAITAQSFVDTYRYALDHQWFRSDSGGSDFVTSPQEIVGAAAYDAGVKAGDTQAQLDKLWAAVGIKLADNNTAVEFTFVNQQSAWNLEYWLSDPTMGPVNIALANAVGADNYGSSPTTTAYDGPYTLSYYQPDQIVRLIKNPNFHDASLYHYTGVNFEIISTADKVWSDFMAGQLDVANVPTASYDIVKNNPGIKFVPGATTFRLMINGAGTVAEQQKLWPDSSDPGYSYKPVALLANQDFKDAMYFAIDRNTLATQVLKVDTPEQFLFSNAYVVDGQTGISYRSTPQGQSVGDNLSTSTYGYNYDLAVSYWNAAIKTLLQNGTYKAGTAANPTIININLLIFNSGNAQVLFGNFIKNAFESTFDDTTDNVKVQVTVIPTAFPDIYTKYMMTGCFDLSIGGISGSTLDAASFLNVFDADNRGGFTLNYGIDTSTANIEVDYTDPSTGKPVRQMWSFDAIESVLNGQVTIQNGVEVPSTTSDTSN